MSLVLIITGMKKIFWKKKPFCKIDFNRHKVIYLMYRKSSGGLFIFFNHFSKLMSANIPVILFTPFNNESYNTETLKAFSEMKKNFIF